MFRKDFNRQYRASIRSWLGALIGEDKATQVFADNEGSNVVAICAEVRKKYGARVPFRLISAAVHAGAIVPAPTEKDFADVKAHAAPTAPVAAPQTAAPEFKVTPLTPAQKSANVLETSALSVGAVLRKPIRTESEPAAESEPTPQREYFPRVGADGSTSYHKVASIVLALCLFLFTASARAQGYGTATFLSGSTNNIAGTATNSYLTNFGVIDATRVNNVALSFGAAAFASTNVSVVYAVFRPSLDGTTNTLATPGSVRVPLTLTGTAFACVTTNIVLNSTGFMFFDSVENASGTPITNVMASYALKPRF